ncbi:hypothetical protein [Sphingobacterium faecium]|jgi:fatty acid desaturase|uniref:hypothetical protein n=1 Tax=Sphingobacterium faecium TaxID=34087 RepID=UPI00097F3333|nr:hypothetical protein [Sphingobacterium faecium]WGQ12912.1 hypothetical protein QG727_12835 [Sphingobacterium faecium]SJN51060.1 hypothetical protein FM120_28745 [Sphingobacterium faecium PCAi_F2.5]
MKEQKETKKEQIATWIAIIICLLPGFWILLFWYGLFELYSKDYPYLLVGIGIIIVAYICYLITMYIIKGIILFIIN